MTSNHAPHDTTHDTTHRSGDHEHHAPTDGQDDKATEHADAQTIPHPRQSAAVKPPQQPSHRSKPPRRRNHPRRVANEVHATLTAGPDGALWVIVDGADVQQVADRISAVCDMLTQRDHPE